MERIWFIFENSEVTGPFSTEDVKKGVDENRWQESALIWWRGQKEWSSLAVWNRDLPQILEARRQAGSRILWYAHRKGKKSGPMSKAELILWLRSFSGDLNEIRIWADTSRQWKTVFDYHEIALEMGINARKTPRAGIFGFVTVAESQLVYQLSMIGAGGFGLESAKGLEPGQLLNVTLKSALLVNPVHATAEVRYVSPSGQAGLMFTQVSMESVSLIMDYVRQYRDTSAHVTEAVEAEAQGRAPKLWYLARNGQQEGPYQHGDLIQMLQWMDDRADVSLWTEGMHHWASLFEFTDILDQAGISRRAGHRAPIKGQISILSPAPGGSFDAASISITGCGFHTDGILKAGEAVEGNIISESFGDPLFFKGTVKYVDPTGYVGVEFTNLTGEIRKRIADYVQLFHKPAFNDEITQSVA